MQPVVKFGIITVIIIATLGWLAIDGITETATYYVTIDELEAMDATPEKRIRVGGDVKVDSISRTGETVAFTIIQVEEGTDVERSLDVLYTGQDPLPDTFRDRAQALCDGYMRSDGVFEAKKIQAKCTSKYEVDPGGDVPVYETEPAVAPADKIT